MNEFIQTIIVLLIVLWSIRLTLKRYLPTWVYHQQQQLANYCHQHKYRALAHYLQPVAPIQTGCDSGCSRCSQSCQTSKNAEQVVKFINK